MVKLPDEILRLKNLKRLDLSGNNLCWLPDKMGQNLARLERLDLSSNRLDGYIWINADLCGLKALKALNLSRNSITWLPTEMAEMKSTAFTELDLSLNELDFDGIRPLKGLIRRLKRLDLAGNLVSLNRIKTLLAGYSPLECQFRNVRPFDWTHHDPVVDPEANRDEFDDEEDQTDSCHDNGEYEEDQQGDYYIRLATDKVPLQNAKKISLGSKFYKVNYLRRWGILVLCSWVSLLLLDLQLIFAAFWAMGNHNLIKLKS